MSKEPKYIEDLRDPKAQFTTAPSGGTEVEARLNKAVKAVMDLERLLRGAKVAERNARKDLAESQNVDG